MNFENLLIYLSDISPEQAYNILKENPNHDCKSAYENIIKKDSKWCFYYAAYVIKDRWKEGEENIKKPFWAFNYALNVIKGRWKEGEKYIKKDAYWFFHYNNEMIK